MKLLPILIFNCILMVSSCSGPASPGGSEITNGKIVSLEGVPVVGITVKAYPLAYIEGKSSPLSVIVTTTDTNGLFRLAIDSAYYNVFIIDTVAYRGKQLPEIGANQDLGTVRLDSLSAINVTVHRSDTLKNVPINTYCKGSPFRKDLSGNDSVFQFNSVPAGSYRLSYDIQPPPTGCAPGGECLGGGVIVQGQDVNIDVTSNKTAVVDAIIDIAK
jgi:hypothetical protein